MKIFELFIMKMQDNAFYPVNELNDINQLSNKIWKPILSSFEDLERRDNIIMGGEYKGNDYVSTVSILAGTFTKSWLNIKPTHKTIYLRLCEVHQIFEGKIIQSHILIDTIDFIRQVDIGQLMHFVLSNYVCSNYRRRGFI